jgi:hypothetical protein
MESPFSFDFADDQLSPFCAAENPGRSGGSRPFQVISSPALEEGRELDGWLGPKQLQVQQPGWFLITWSIPPCKFTSSTFLILAMRNEYLSLRMKSNIYFAP